MIFLLFNLRMNNIIEIIIIKKLPTRMDNIIAMIKLQRHIFRSEKLMPVRTITEWIPFENKPRERPNFK